LIIINSLICQALDETYKNIQQKKIETREKTKQQHKKVCFYPLLIQANKPATKKKKETQNDIVVLRAMSEPNFRILQIPLFFFHACPHFH